MDLTSVLFRASYEASKGVYSKATADRINPQIETAAEATAETYRDEIPDDDAPLLHDLFSIVLESDTLDAELTELKQRGEPVSTDAFVRALQQHTEEDFDGEWASIDFEEAAGRFLENLERELKPSVQRKLVIAYLQEIHAAATNAENPVDRLNEQGITWLAEVDFASGDINPEYCWRRPFKFAEIRDGYAIDRQRPDDERTNVTDELVHRLKQGENQLVIGPPGSGKTTICKSVATRWHDDDRTGSVFYRENGATKPLTDPDEVIAAIEDGMGHGSILVVVEDAVRHEAIRIHEVIDSIGDANVSFLLNSRNHEWRNFRDVVRSHDDIELNSDRWQRILEDRFQFLNQYQVPILDEHEVGRVVDRFIDKTDTNRDLLLSPETIFERIALYTDIEDGTRSTGPSPMLLMAYYLPIGGITISDSDDEPGSPLRSHVREVYDSVEDPESDDLDLQSAAGVDLLRKIGLLINVLNSADIGVHEELLHAFADTTEERQDIGAILDYVEGRMVFGTHRDNERHYWSNHEIWSMFYLDHFLDSVPAPRNREWFEAVVNAVVTLPDDLNRQTTIEETFQEKTALLRALEEHPGSLADRFLTAIFEMGVRKPRLAPLFGRTNHSGITIPNACSEMIRYRCALWRFSMYRNHGRLTASTEEQEIARELANEVGLETEQIDKIYFNNLGNVAHARGDFDQARDYYEQSLDIQRDIGDRSGQATSLNNLGLVAYSQGDFDQARDYHEQSLDIQRDIGDRSGQADSLNNLGNVAGMQDNYELASEYHEQSLEIKRELGDRAGIANSLSNLGTDAERQGDYEAARDYYEQSFEIYHDIGATRDTLDLADNLVTVNEELGQTDDALEWCETALDLIERVDLPLTDERLTFRIHMARLDASRKDVNELYRLGLRHVLANNGTIAMQLFRSAWERNDSLDPDTDQYPNILAAGVGFAAHLALFDDEDTDADRKKVLEAIEPHRDLLSNPSMVVFEYLTTGSTDVTPDTLVEDVDPGSDNVEDWEQDELEAVAFARLLGALLA